MDHLSVHHRAHPLQQRQQQAVSLSPTSLSARGEYGEDSMSDRFSEGQDVLARWSDGLFYLGTIAKVSVRMMHMMHAGKRTVWRALAEKLLKSV